MPHPGDRPGDDDQGHDRRPRSRQNDAGQSAQHDVATALDPGSPVDTDQARHGEEAGHELHGRADDLATDRQTCVCSTIIDRVSMRYKPRLGSSQSATAVRSKSATGA